MEWWASGGDAGGSGVPGDAGITAHCGTRPRRWSLYRQQATRAAIARLAAREADARKDWIKKTTTSVVRRFGALIVIEDLKVANMVKSAAGTVEAPGTNVAAKRGLNRQIHNQAWGTFRRRLTDKTTAAGVTLVAVNPAGTSQRCSSCGHTASENRESQAVLRCRRCGHSNNADVNAAHNILAAGRAVTEGAAQAHDFSRGSSRTRPLGPRWCHRGVRNWGR